MSTGHRNKRWSHQALVKQAELCSIYSTVDSKVTFENWRRYVILSISLVL